MRKSELYQLERAFLGGNLVQAAVRGENSDPAAYTIVDTLEKADKVKADVWPEKFRPA